MHHNEQSSYPSLLPVLDHAEAPPILASLNL
jgi:hypothetical protein